MTAQEAIGVIKNSVLQKTIEEATIEWKVHEFSTIAKNEGTRITYYDSPTFSINDVTWYLRLYPRALMNRECMRLYIKTDVARKYAIEYWFSLEKLNGRRENFVGGILERNEICSDMQDFIKLSDLMKQLSAFAPQDTLTIICTLRRNITCSTQPTAMEKAIPMTFIRLDKLSENFKDLFTDKETCDTTLKVKDKEYKAHRSVLIARSSVFAANFKYDTLERQTGVIIISDCDPDSFGTFLKYLYCGQIQEISCSCALNLYHTSDKYDIPELKTFCMEYLMQYLTVENICEIAVFADKYDETKLFTAVQDFFNKNMDKIFVTSEWQCFMKENIRLSNELLIEMSKVKIKD